MLGLILFSIFIFIVIAIVTIEVRNEKKYQEERGKRSNKKKIKPLEKSKDHAKLEKENQEELQSEKSKKDKQEKDKKQEENKIYIKLPTCKYPKFTHIRLVEMGLSEEEAKEFVQELITQIETQIPLIKIELHKANFRQMERLTHSLKGSATNLGTGGVSDLLVECNTYLKTGTDADIAEVYFEYLKHYTAKLREQYL